MYGMLFPLTVMVDQVRLFQMNLLYRSDVCLIKLGEVSGRDVSFKKVDFDHVGVSLRRGFACFSLIRYLMMDV